MENAKHTPGPWHVRFADNGGVLGIESSEPEDEPGAVGWVVRQRGFGSPTSEAGKANAKLIAAAPELLSACEKALWALSGLERDPERLQEAATVLSAALVKAKADSESQLDTEALKAFQEWWKRYSEPTDEPEAVPFDERIMVAHCRAAWFAALAMERRRMIEAT